MFYKIQLFVCLSSYEHKLQIPQKPEPKECTKPEPFQLESLIRHEEELQRMMEERARAEKEEAEKVDIGEEKEFGDMGPGGNVGRLYRELRKELEGGKGEGLCGFEDAVERHRLLEGLYTENGVNP